MIIRNRISGKLEEELVYGGKALKFLYGDVPLTPLLLKCICEHPLFSRLYGKLQTLSSSKKKVQPFIKAFDVDASEFEQSPDSFTSFNDFFIRTLKKEARPINPDPTVAVIPADGRFLGFQNIAMSDGFFVKGQKFDLKKLLLDEPLAKRYAEGSMVIARLCPTDYHRFHFPVDCTPSKTTLINGFLYSVNPLALKKNCQIFAENKRCYTLLETKDFGTILYMEIGATSVGTIIETFEPERPYQKGDEKGYFSFGGSALVLLFEPGKIQLDADLAQSGKEKIELRCLLGQSLGRTI